MKTVISKSLLQADYRVNEEIKRLRTNLLYMDPNQKVINISSSIGKEGKSLVSYWLSHSLAEFGKKVLLIDGNLRGRGINDILDNNDIKSDDRKNEKLLGLSEFLKGNITKDDIIIHAEKPGFDVILSGEIPNNPSELLGNNKFADLIKQLRELYEFIIIDTPAIIEVTDASIIASLCDSVLLVIEPGITSYKTAQKVKEQIELSGTKLLGVVLNKI